MPLSTSPRLLPPVEISGDIRPQESQKDFFCTELPARPQVSPPSTSQPYEETMSITNASRAIAPSNNSHTQQAPMILDPESMQWSAQGRYPHNSLAQDAFCTSTLLNPDSACNRYPLQAQNGMSYNANSIYSYPSHYSPSCPRAYNGIDFTGLPSDMNPSYPPSTFFHSPPHIHSTPSLANNSTPELMRLSDDYDLHYASHIKPENQIDYNSPYSDMSRASTPYSTGHEEDNPVDKEQPYAQLIYRALLDAPDHTMVLRDIYDWFRRYTDKAAYSETKGWQNSIRHNLSMNGAFEKVDSPADATTKGFMWRLTPAALREGVKSTTRYRSKAANKRPSGRTQPLPQRQASGAKGGHAARRAANLRRSQRAREAGLYRSDPRSEPYTGYSTEWEGEGVYGGATPLPPRVGSPYSAYSGRREMSFSPYHAPKDNEAFRPMLGMTSHLSPLRSYASTPVTPNTSMSHAGLPLGDGAYILEQAPGEPLFSGSPTPSADEPITPTEGRVGWEQDVAMGIDVYNDLTQFGMVV